MALIMEEDNHHVTAAEQQPNALGAGQQVLTVLSLVIWIVRRLLR
jgi:hypothetical protein